MKKSLLLVTVVLVALFLPSCHRSENRAKVLPKVPFFPPIHKDAAKVVYAYQFEFQNHKFEVRKWPGKTKYYIKMDKKIYYPQWEGQVGKGFRIVTVNDPSVNMTLTNDGTCLWFAAKHGCLTVDAGLKETLCCNAEIESLDGRPIYIDAWPSLPGNDDQRTLYDVTCFVNGEREQYQIVQGSYNKVHRDVIRQFLRTFREIPAK